MLILQTKFHVCHETYPIPSPTIRRSVPPWCLMNGGLWFIDDTVAEALWSCCIPRLGLRGGPLIFDGYPTALAGACPKVGVA